MVRRRSIVLSALGAGATALYARQRLRSPRPGWSYLAGAPLLIAHRGGAHLAPENTLIAFRRALDWWHSDILELDVQPTADGHAVVFHDETLDRTTNGSGAVAEHDLATIQRLDAGYRFTPDGSSFPFRDRDVRVSTLEEVLEAFPTTRINIEIKDGRAQDAVRRAVTACRAHRRVLIAAGSRRNRSALADLPVPVSAGSEELRPFVIQAGVGLSLYKPGVDALQVPDRWEGRDVLSPALIRIAHSQNLAVHVWSVNDVPDMRTFLEWGVDGIITDRPDRLAKVLHERVGRPLPPGPPDDVPEPFLEYLLRDSTEVS